MSRARALVRIRSSVRARTARCTSLVIMNKTMFTLAAALALSCSTPTKVTEAWKDPSFAGPMGKVVVVAEGVTPATRQLVEDRFTSELTQRGVAATPSHATFGETLPTLADGNALKQRGFDGVFVVNVGRGQERRTKPPDSSFPYQWGPGFAASQDHVQAETVVTSQVSLWDLRDQKRVWTASAVTSNPSDGGDIAKSLSKKVMPALEKDGVVSAR